jgi:hypothetical protein
VRVGLCGCVRVGGCVCARVGGCAEVFCLSDNADINTADEYEPQPGQSMSRPRFEYEHLLNVSHKRYPSSQLARS